MASTAAPTPTPTHTAETSGLVRNHCINVEAVGVGPHQVTRTGGSTGVPAGIGQQTAIPQGVAAGPGGPGEGQCDPRAEETGEAGRPTGPPILGPLAEADVPETINVGKHLAKQHRDATSKEDC